MVSGHFPWMHAGDSLKFCMLMYPDHLQNWLDFGHALFGQSFHHTEPEKLQKSAKMLNHTGANEQFVYFIITFEWFNVRRILIVISRQISPLGGRPRSGDLLFLWHIGICVLPGCLRPQGLLLLRIAEWMHRYRYQIRSDRGLWWGRISNYIHKFLWDIICGI